MHIARVGERLPRLQIQFRISRSFRPRNLANLGSKIRFWIHRKEHTLSLAWVSIGTHKLSPSPVNIGVSGPLTKKIRKTCVTLCYSKFGSQILPNYVASASPRSVISVTQRFFCKMRNAARILLRVWRRMTIKACIDAF